MSSSWLTYLPAFIRERVEGRQTLQNIISNAGWLFFDKVLRMGVGLLVNIWVVRYLGPDQFGMLSYAIAFVALFATFATLGLDGIVVRELVRTPDKSREILGSALVLRLIGGAASLVLCVASFLLLRQGDPLGTMLIAVIAAGMVFQAFDVIDFWFQSQMRSRNTVIAKNSAFLLAAGVKIGLIVSHAPLTMFAWTALLEIILGAIGMIVFFRRSGYHLSELSSTSVRCRHMLSDSWPMVLSGLSIAVYMKIDQIMLGDMAGNSAVGIYTSATKLSEIWYMIPMIVVSSVFPVVIQSKTEDELLYHRRITRLFSLMAALSLLIAVPMSLCSNWVVTVMYGNAYQAAGPVLAIHIWASLFVFYGVAQGPWDLAENLTRLAMVRIVIGATVNILLNYWLIPVYGPLGAAVATVVSQSLAAVFLNALHKKTRPIFYCQLKSLLFVRYLRGL
ncbi:MAG: flippase [Desulfuromonadaceae bacterium]|nr:flippase [Desulfuromonadaceae bacterium]